MKSKLHSNCVALSISRTRYSRSIEGIPDTRNLHDDETDGISVYGSSSFCTLILAPFTLVFMIVAATVANSKRYQDLQSVDTIHMHFARMYGYVDINSKKLLIPSSGILLLNSNNALLFSNSFKVNSFP